jgi:hypothetical protein
MRKHVVAGLQPGHFGKRADPVGPLFGVNTLSKFNDRLYL